MKKAPTKKAGRKTKAIVKGTAKKGRPMKAKRGRTAKKKVGISKRPQLTEEQKALKKERTEKKKMALKHSEDRLKAQFIRSLQPQAKRAASPILQYISETVSKLREEKNLSPQEAVKEATKQYQALTDAQKQKYVKKFEQQKVTLKEEWDKYEAKYGYPALPASGWLAYLNGRRAELVASNPSLGTKEKLTEVTQLVAAEWKKLSDSEKQNNKFFDHSKYEAAMKEYHEKKQKIDDKLLAQFNQWKEARAAKKEANKAKKQAAIPSS